MFDGSVEDRLAIRERIEAYSDAVFRHDADAWIANWADDGVWRLPGIDVAGKTQIKAAWQGAMSAFAVAGFFATPGAIEVRGDRASVRVYTQEVLIDHAGAVRRIIGAYDDELVKTKGAWLFASRSYKILHDQT
ncbi:nuclear transport factor 2 family protein [Phenylobacterium sp.]|uniref:nuclear transport factor 2 family protein n=1 Tax=Phenylobacterium sp. TaxID=1871053 RepID=UPI00286AE863|nr:nuclear transport factor 2 family protein [Phenylobacterium sp.]